MAPAGPWELFFLALGLIFRAQARKNFGGFFGVFWCFCFFLGVFLCFLFFFVFRALARNFFGFFSRGAVSKTGNSRSVIIIDEPSAFAESVAFGGFITPHQHKLPW